MRWRERDGVRWLSASLPGAEVAFSTRIGGTSQPPFDRLNLGLLTGDDPDAVRSNRSRLAAALGLDPGMVAIGRQVHGAELAAHAAPQRPAPFATAGADPPEVDGHWTTLANLGLLVFVADCLPIALSGPGGVAMLHGGWRGLAAGIIAAGAGALATGGGVTSAAIGPGIGPCCYEVGDEVRAAFGGLGLEPTEGATLDLPELAARLLERAGVEVAERSELCTRCNPELFFSHRGLGPDTGRQGGVVWRPT